ncbi:MAG: ABC transporter substrate-binding protein [Planctomycetota bacterium]
MTSTRTRSWLSATCVLVLILVGDNSASAQYVTYAQVGAPPEMGLELLQEEPHDLIFFTEAAKGGWVKARLLNLPSRRLPAQPTGMLRFEIVNVEQQVFSARWLDIERVDLWEERLERETKERIASGDFSGAYPFLSILIRDYPARRGLRDLRCEFLWKNAYQQAQREDLGSTLAMLEELRRYAPDYKSSTVLRALGAMSDRLINGLVNDEELDLAQQMLARLKDDYGKSLSSVAKWDKEFLRMATEKREAAIDAMQRKDYRSARQLARESIYLKPEIEGGEALVEEIDKIYPLIKVGVLQTASRFDPTRIDNWAARRSGRLLYRVLFEIKNAGPEGGEYDFIFGDPVELSTDRMQFALQLRPNKIPPPLDQITSFYLSDVLADRAQPGSQGYFSPWAAAIRSIEIESAQSIVCRLQRPNVLPQCLLQVVVDGSWFGGKPKSPTGDYIRGEADETVVRYTLKGAPRDATQPREIVEVRSESATQAVGKLVRGEIDVLDQLIPSDAAKLSKSRSIRVAQYPLPSMHLLVPCSDHPYLAERTFRRALVYGTNRQDILRGELLENRTFEGCQVVSGPFPAGMDKNDSLGYAYDRSILPRTYEPRLAKLLMEVNKSQMEAAATRREETLPPMRPIRLAYPPSNLARIACEAIRSQWQLLDLDVQLVELPVGRTYPDDGEADLVYSTVALWEPVIDARRVLGPKGLAKSTDQLVGLGLRRLEESKNWRDARLRLLDLHGIAHHELPVLPLWQMVDSYAYRKNLVGVGSDIVSLYQNADRWRLSR